MSTLLRKREPIRFLSMAGAFCAALVAAVVLFRDAIEFIRSGRWERVVTFSEKVDLAAMGVTRTQLPFSHHNARGGPGDYYLFNREGKTLASETSVISADSRYWLWECSYPVSGTEHTVYLLQPFSIVSYTLGRLGEWLLIVILILVVTGWATSRILGKA